jgi:uncharacterized protein with von Willebrand factor type A (vWA) domain
MKNIFYPEDYKFGTAEEEKHLETLRRFFKRDIKKSEDRYSKQDYYDDLYNYEMKSRTNNYSKYPTTMITEDKITKNKNLILLFNFTDSLYYIEYNEEKFKNYRREIFSRANIDWNEKPHLYIPIEDLTLIERREAVPVCWLKVK